MTKRAMMCKKWNKFAQGYWSLKAPTKMGTYPAFWKHGVVYISVWKSSQGQMECLLEVGGHETFYVQKWPGLWWSEPRPKFLPPFTFPLYPSDKEFDTEKDKWSIRNRFLASG